MEQRARRRPGRTTRAPWTIKWRSGNDFRLGGFPNRTRPADRSRQRARVPRIGGGRVRRDGQIGGDRIVSDQALPALAIEFWGPGELDRAPDLVKNACTQAFAAKFDLEPWFLSRAEITRLKASYDAHSDTPGFDPSPPEAAVRSLNEGLSSEGGATPRPSSELFEDAKDTPKSKGRHKSRMAAEEAGSDEEDAPKPKPTEGPAASGTKPQKPHEHGSLATVLATPQAPQAPGPRVSSGSVAKSVVDAQAVASIQNKANRALRETHHNWPQLLEALEFDTECEVASRQPPLVNAELAEYLRNQERGLRFIRHAAAGYALSGAPGGPGMVAALSEETADWTFAHFLGSCRGEVNVGHFERVYGIPPLVKLASAVLCKYFTPPGVSPTCAKRPAVAESPGALGAMEPHERGAYKQLAFPAGRCAVAAHRELDVNLPWRPI